MEIIQQTIAHDLMRYKTLSDFNDIIRKKRPHPSNVEKQIWQPHSGDRRWLLKNSIRIVIWTLGKRRTKIRRVSGSISFRRLIAVPRSLYLFLFYYRSFIFGISFFNEIAWLAARTKGGGSHPAGIMRMKIRVNAAGRVVGSSRGGILE